VFAEWSRRGSGSGVPTSGRWNLRGNGFGVYLRLMEAERKWKAEAYCCIVKCTRPDEKNEI
jgi:hypothetical protein